MTAPPGDGEGTGTVGEIRAILARHGVPHTPETHFALVASAPGPDADLLTVITCCDHVDLAATLLGAGIEALTGELPVAPVTGRVIVGRADLGRALALAGTVEPPGPHAVAALRRLHEALAEGEATSG